MPYKDKEKQKEFQRRATEKVRAFLRDLKEQNPCMDCGESFPYYVMEFDHVPERGEKRYSVASICSRSLQSEMLLAELAKCDIVCSNCHSIRTYHRGQQRHGLRV